MAFLYSGIAFLPFVPVPPVPLFFFLIEYMQGPEPPLPQSRNPVAMGVKLSAAALRSYFATHPHWEKRKDRILAEIRKLKQ